MCYPTIETVQNEVATKFLGIELKYLVKALEFHLKAAKEEEDYTNSMRFDLDLGNAKQILEKFCTIFPEHTPEL